MKAKDWELGCGFPDFPKQDFTKFEYPKRDMGIVEPIKQRQIYFCALCGGNGTSSHHLFPKSAWKRMNPKPLMRFMRLCGKCHNDIHFYFSVWELALKFNTPETIKPELEKRKTWKLL
jgi:hypothetical protein